MVTEPISAMEHGSATVAGRQPSAARTRILESAYELFTQRRIVSVSVNEVIARAEVTKATFYHHFPSKDDLVLAYLALRDQRATLDWLQAGARERADTPEERLLAIFELFEDWFVSPEFAGCPFINVLLEFGPQHANGSACVGYLDNVRSVVGKFAEEAGLREPEAFARAFHVLMKGSIVSAVEGDASIAQTAKAMARTLIDQHR